MRNNNFEKQFEERRKLFKRIFITMFLLVIVATFAQLGFIYYGYTKVEENGGFQKTATDILRVVKQIDKDSDK